MTKKLVRDLMTTDVETLSMHETVDLAATILTLARIRHLPVTDHHSRVRGVVTHRDVLETLARMYEDKGPEATLASIQVEQIMTRTPATVGPDTSLSDAATMMFEQKFGCLPVVENEKLVGIITEADFVFAAIEDGVKTDQQRTSPQ